MNQLSGRFVNVVLAIEEGRGMEFLKNHVNISANFNGRILESDKVPPSESPAFNTELVWEIEKKDLRKIRSSNQPLRVECLTTDDHRRKERVGFALFSLRSAHIIPLKDSKQEIIFKWQKLIGCQTDKKHCHPELYVSLTIRDHLLSETEEVNPQTMPYISEEETEISEESFESSVPVQYLEDGYIQIGPPDEAIDVFSFDLLVKQASNLDTLLPEVLVFGENKEKYYMTFKIFGITIKTKPFYKELHNVIVLNERIVVRLMSSLRILKEFFANQNVSINFFHGSNKLGTANIRLQKVLPEDIYENFFLNTSVFKYNDRYFFKFPSPNGIIPFDSSDSSPYIEIENGLKYIEKRTPKEEIILEEKQKTKTVVSNIPKNIVNASGDQTNGNFVLDKITKVETKSKSDHEYSIDEDKKISTTQSCDSIVRNIPLTPKSTTASNILEIYKKYILEVTLKNILWKKSPRDKKILFKFLHPKAASFITILKEVDNIVGENINLTNLTFVVSYVSTPKEIKNLLNAWPPKLVLTDEKERLLSEEYEVSTTFLLEGTNTYNYSAEIRSVRVLDILCKIQIGLYFKELDLDESRDKIRNLVLTPPVLDELITIREATDLNKWKIIEKEKFQKELEFLKNIEVEKLQKEWEERKQILEEQLTKNINKCKVLQETLQVKLDSLKTNKELIRRRNRSNVYEEIFKENWSTFKSADHKEIIEELSRFQRDNEHLRQIVDEHKRKLRNLEKSALTKEQTTNLLHELRGLEEKFFDAQKAKRYFKDQWKKACEEIHELKTEDYKQLQNHIQQSKEELSQLSLDHFIENRGQFEDIFSLDGIKTPQRFL